MSTGIQLPPKETPRKKRVVVAFTDDELAPLNRLAKERDQPRASLARALILAALETLAEGARAALKKPEEGGL